MVGYSCWVLEYGCLLGIGIWLAVSVSVSDAAAASSCAASCDLALSPPTVSALVTINQLSGSLPAAFSYTNNGASEASAALWCSAVKVAFAANTDGLLYIDPDGKRV